MTLPPSLGVAESVRYATPAIAISVAALLVLVWDRVARGGKIALCEQPVEGVAAALEVADEVVHGPILLRLRAFGFDSPRTLLRGMAWTLRCSYS